MDRASYGLLGPTTGPLWCSLLTAFPQRRGAARFLIVGYVHADTHRFIPWRAHLNPRLARGLSVLPQHQPGRRLERYPWSKVLTGITHGGIFFPDRSVKNRLGEFDTETLGSLSQHAPRPKAPLR
jgi:hypothetical protein